MATEAMQTGAARRASEAPAPLTWRGLVIALLLAAILAWLGSYWILAAEFITYAARIAEAVPTIPGLASLLLLLLLWPLFRRLPVLRRMSPGQVTVIYVFVTVSTFQMCRGIGQHLLALLTVPHYHTTAAAPIHTLVEQLPAWVMPSNPLVHRWFFEGSPTGLTPWGPWALPIAAWTGFFVMFASTLLCLMLLMADRWIDHERLAFPLVRLPLEMMGRGTSGSFFRNPMSWVGIGAAVLLNGTGIVRAVFFGRSLGGGALLGYDFSAALVGQPWEALRPLVAAVRPEVLGLGYLLSTDLSFSVWFFWALAKFQALALSVVGLRLSGAPFFWEQGMGGYLMLAAIILWRERASLGRALRAWLVPAEPQAKGDVMRQWAMAGALLGAAGLIVFAAQVGMDWWLAVTYLSLVLLVSLVYARMRAEAGVPLVYVYPHAQPAFVITNFLGQGPLVAGRGGLRSMTALYIFDLLSRGWNVHVSAYQLEGLRLGRLTGVSWQQSSATLLSAAALGTLASFVLPFRLFYDKGAGDWGGWPASLRPHYAAVLNAEKLPALPNVPRIVATLFGSGLTALLVLIRSYFPAFPLNPMGYVILGTRSDWTWFSFFLVWLLKGSILRYGGGGLYLYLLPVFIGFAVGHYVVTGVIWAGLAVIFRGPFLRYTVSFG